VTFVKEGGLGSAKGAWGKSFAQKVLFDKFLPTRSRQWLPELLRKPTPEQPLLPTTDTSLVIGAYRDLAMTTAFAPFGFDARAFLFVYLLHP
jgi:hypothetical protein